MPIDPIRHRQGKTALDARAGLHQRLSAYVPASEMQRFTRTLAALEAHHTNELHAATRSAHESKLQGDAAEGYAAVLKHSASAKEAKQACAIEALKADASRQERMLTAKDGALAVAIARAEAAERRAETSETALSAEVGRLEAEAGEYVRLLREFALAHEVKSEHLAALQQQTAKSSTLLAHLQEQSTSMQRRLAAQQRKSLRLQESQHLASATARSWGYERKQLLMSAAHAEQAGREAATRTLAVEEELARIAHNAEAERTAHAIALRQQRELAVAAEHSLRLELRGVQALRTALLEDNCRVTLKSGSQCTVGQYVRAFEERQIRQRRGGGASALAAAPAVVAMAATEGGSAMQSAAGPQPSAAGDALQHPVMLGGGGGMARR